eukprot:c4018_g1_i1 orf=2-238(-)
MWSFSSIFLPSTRRHKSCLQQTAKGGRREVPLKCFEWSTPAKGGLHSSELRFSLGRGDPQSEKERSTESVSACMCVCVC